MKILFSGPTLAKDVSRLEALHPSIVFAPPAGWGDIGRAVLRGVTAIGVVDGRFEDTRAVWHKEILFALSLGVSVGGAASMGALRAVECAPFGMVGVGRIFRRYSKGTLTRDADVSQIHAPAELGYASLSDPWVNVEPTLRLMASSGMITEEELAELSIAARRLHYKETTYARLFALVGLSKQRSSHLTDWLKQNRLDQKRLDALELVQWLVECRDTRGPRPEWTFSETLQWRSLMDEIVRHPERCPQSRRSVSEEGASPSRLHRPECPR